MADKANFPFILFFIFLGMCVKFSLLEVTFNSHATQIFYCLFSLFLFPFLMIYSNLLAMGCAIHVLT
jgi:hypothetical protein